MGKCDAAGSKQMGILKGKTLEVQGKEMDEANHMHTSVYHPQSFRKYVDSDSEEPEMDSEDDPEEEPEEDPEEEPEEDPEEEPEEDPEEEPEEDLELDGKLCNEKVTVECATPFKLSDEIISAEHGDEDSAADFVFEPNSQGETNKVHQNLSDGKRRIMVNKAVRHSLSQKYGLGKNCKYDEASEEEFKIKYAAIGQHCVPGELEEAVVGNEKFGKQANPGKRRCSKWDQGSEDDKKAIIEDRECKKGKTKWDANDSKSTLQEPLTLTDLRSSLCGPLLDLEVQTLRKRFSEISSILDPLVDDKLLIGMYAPYKLIKEREKIFLELAKRNAIISKELYVPVKEYPTYNFIGLILGPKGNTQKRMELKSGARIRLRGKDFSKSAQEADPSEDEDLNVYIEAINQKSLDAAVCMVEKLLIPVEDEMNDHKRGQLQESYNLKAESYISSCSVCKEPGHNQLACPQKKTTLKVACDTCGSFSHPTSGCPVTPLDLKIKYSKEISAAKLYVGFLPQTVNDSRLRELFSPFGTITDSVVIIDQINGCSKGYGFVKFDTPSAASLAIMHMNGCLMDGHRLAVRIAGTPPATGSPTTSLFPVNPIPEPSAIAISCPALPHYMMPDAANLYIGFLPQTVDDSRLRALFSPFGTITQSRVPLDLRTGYSMGYGFVRFDTPSAASLAIMHMNGYQINGHRLRVRVAGAPPATGQPATSHLSVLFNSGPAAVATSYPASPHYMMPKAQVSVLHGEGTGFSSSLNLELSGQSSQTEAPVIPQRHVSGSSESSSAYLSSGLASASTKSSSAFSSTVATNSPTLPDCMMQEPQVSVLNGEGLSYPSINMEQLTNLYIGFLPQTVDINHLWELFSPFGTITQLKVALDQTGYSKGYGFVRFDTPSAASLAIMHMNGCEIDGHKLIVKIADTPHVRGQLATNLLHVYPNPGPTAVPTSYPASPYYMMQKEQVSVLNGEGIGFPSLLESSNQFSQTEAPIIPREVSGSTVSTTAAGSLSNLTESKIASLSTSLVSRSSESSTTYSPIGLVSAASTELGSEYSSTVATSCLALPDYMVPQAQLSVLNGEGLGYPSSPNMEYLSNLKIGFLPQTVDDIRLWELFSPFGTITQLKVALDRTGYSKGYGFVKFDTPSVASLAIMHMNGYEIDGHKLTVKIAGTLPVGRQPATNLFHIYPNPGPAAVATSYPTSLYYMMQKAQVSALNGESIGFPSSLNLESSNQFSQTEAPIIPQELSGSTTAISSTGSVSSLTESRTGLSTGLFSGSTESGTVFSSAGLVSLSTESRSASLTKVATSVSALPYCMNQSSQTEAPFIPQGVSGSTGSSPAISSTAFVSRSTEPGARFSSIGVISGSTESRTSLFSTGLVAASAESRSVISSYSFSSLFCGDSKYPGS